MVSFYKNWAVLLSTYKDMRPKFMPIGTSPSCQLSTEATRVVPSSNIESSSGIDMLQ